MIYDLAGMPDRVIPYRITGSDEIHVLEVWGSPDPQILPIYIAQEHQVPNAAVELLAA